MHNHTTELTIGLSFLLGALHALEPGHGKTAMFVYMLGGRRSMLHPIVMGLSTALSHSLSLFAIAFAVHLTHHLVAGDHHHEARVSGILQWVSAGLVMAVGAYLLIQAARGKRQRCCGHHGEPHEHDQQLVSLGGAEHAGCGHRAHQPPPEAAPVKEHGNYRTTALLGLAIGLLPCPSALAAYFTSLSSGSPAAGYLIIGIFAAGIACSLTVAGFILQQFGDRLSQRMQQASRLPWAYVRAALVLGIGAFYTIRLLMDGVA